MEYEPELGQMCFGQPWQLLKISGKVERALQALQCAWNAIRRDDNPFENTGARYDGKNFQVHAYSWNDEEEQEFNFAWRDVRVSWYKYLGRGTTINREMSDVEVAEMLHECMVELLSTAKKGHPASQAGS